jgi:uncharacterized membrane protein
MQEGRGPDAEWWDDSLADGDDPVVGAVALGVLGAGLGSLFGIPILEAVDFWVIFAIGYAVVVPSVSLLRGRDGASPASPRAEGAADASEAASEGDVDAALDRLRDRYARGELSDEQFERKLETLLETETPEDARARLDRGRDTDAVDREVDRER